MKKIIFEYPPILNNAKGELRKVGFELEYSGLTQTLEKRLREYGAIGTKAAYFYAFGFHINPEVASITVDEILNTLRTFFLLYDYLAEIIKPDMSRRLTPYIDPFDKEYIEDS